ncbi:MAG: hypothetical protein ACFFCZ_17215 [Promethearchaeota archaeon]
MSKSIILFEFSSFTVLRAVFPLIRIPALVIGFYSLSIPDIAILIIFAIIIIAVVAVLVLLYYLFLRTSKSNS